MRIRASFGRHRRKGVAVAVCSFLALLVVASHAGSGRTGVSAVAFAEASAALGVAEPTGKRVDVWGVAVTDWDGDGCDDLYVGRHTFLEPRLYRNGCPGSFTDEADRLREAQNPYRGWDRHAVAFGHFDADGRADLFISTGGATRQSPPPRGASKADQLYHQLPDGDFEDLAPALGITDWTGRGRFGAWVDYDGDGDLDLLVGHGNRADRDKNLLWRNDGGSFTNVAVQAGLANLEISMSGVASDVDGDGDPDLITAPGRGVSLYLNRGDGTFAFSSLGPSTVLSVAPGDYDNDGDIDLFLSRAHRSGRAFVSMLLRNDGPGQWKQLPASAGASYTHAGSALWLDADNDGWLDLFIVREATDTGVKMPNVLLLNQRDGTFADVASQAGVTGPSDSSDNTRSSGAWGDFDRDGRVDLVVLTGVGVCPPGCGSVQLYLNRTDSGNHWLTLHLHQANGNPDALGAKLWATAGGITQYRELTSGTADKSQSPPYFMLGLGPSPSVDTLRIRWPDGTLATFTNVLGDRHYALDKGGGLRQFP